jgi:hypothetical protein
MSGLLRALRRRRTECALQEERGIQTEQASHMQPVHSMLQFKIQRARAWQNAVDIFRDRCVSDISEIVELIESLGPMGTGFWLGQSRHTAWDQSSDFYRQRRVSK